MVQLTCRYWNLVVFVVLSINLIFGENCGDHIDDFFYNADFAGPFFDQSVYTVSNFLVSNPKNTRLFDFSVYYDQSQTRPSYFNLTENGIRSVKLAQEFDVISNDPTFAVEHIGDNNYRLVTNVESLSYSSPYHRYLFELIVIKKRPNQSSLRSTAIVQINLVNNNGNAPRFLLEPKMLYISDAALPGTQFGTVYAYDPDGDSVIYATNSSQFSIDPVTGVLQLRREFPRYCIVSCRYFVHINATDDDSSCGDPGLCAHRSSLRTIEVIVLASNRHPPEFLNPRCNAGSIQLYENMPENTIVESLLVIDHDRVIDSSIDIIFPPEKLTTTGDGSRNTAYAQFHIEKKDLGNNSVEAYIKTNKTFDYDDLSATREWHLMILAHDSGEVQRQTLCSLHIKLIDINDNPPVFLNSKWDYTIYTSSNSISNHRLFQIHAWDADSGRNKEIDYFILNTSLRYFQIERDTGWITYRDDFHNLQLLNASLFPMKFYVYAQDRGKPSKRSSTNAEVTINLNHESAPNTARWDYPEWKNDVYNISISEKFYEINPHTPIFDAMNKTGFDGSIKFQLPHNPSIIAISDPFYTGNIQSLGGQLYQTNIYLQKSLDAEIQNNYFLRLEVHDDPPLISWLNITIIDENDHIPTFDIRSLSLTILADDNINRPIAHVQAFDRDIDENNKYIEYYCNTDLTSATTRSKFHVESDGTVWISGTFENDLSENTSYRLFITAVNTKSRAWNSTRNFTQDFQLDIKVVHIDNNSPKFSDSSPQTITISELFEKNKPILTFNITDDDINASMTLGILSGNDRNAFAFIFQSNNENNTTRKRYEAVGELVIVGSLDYRLKSNYNLVLFAFDGSNFISINVLVNLAKNNTRAPQFNLMPGFSYYEYELYENSSELTFNGPKIKVTDEDDGDDNPTYPECVLYDNRRQFNIMNLERDSYGYLSIKVDSSGLSHDLPFGSPSHIFAIKATNSYGVSSYAPVRIQVIGKNNKAPIPMINNCIKQGNNQIVDVKFYDYDNNTGNAHLPYTIQIIEPSNVQIDPRTGNSNFTLKYIGNLNRTEVKHFNVTVNASDSNGNSRMTTVSIIVCDELQSYPISDATKDIRIVYVNGYEKSFKNIDLGSVFVRDSNDWFQADRIYSIRDENHRRSFDIVNGQLRAINDAFNDRYVIEVDVEKRLGGSKAVSTINVIFDAVDGDIVRQATTIRIQGEYPETLIDQNLGYPINKLRSALATVLSVHIDLIHILCIRSVYQYQIPYQPSITLELAKTAALTDVIFDVSTLSRLIISDTLKSRLNQLKDLSSINVIAVEPDPCTNYACPLGTHCKATRTINSKPLTIDSNQTSFVGINILNSADCINSVNVDSLQRSSSSCPDGLSASGYDLSRLQSIKNERSFMKDGQGYASYKAEAFSTFAPTRFSFDFLLQTLIQQGLILLYGRHDSPMNDFPWVAFDIYNGELRFHYGNQIKTFEASHVLLKTSTWYHVECQFVHSQILISINDYQCFLDGNDQSTKYDRSNVLLYIGGVPPYELINHLYPSLPFNNTFDGCIRNVLSNGCYLDMSQTVDSTNSAANSCPYAGTRTTPTARFSNLVPWYTWLIIALVLLFLATILMIVLVICHRRKYIMRVLTDLYIHDTRDNIVDYKEYAGEQDHLSYDLRVLQKPVYHLPDGSATANNDQIGYPNSTSYYRPALGDFIDDRLNEQVLSYANDTKLHYLYEGNGSIDSSFSSIQPPSPTNQNQYEYLRSLGPKFSNIADLYTETKTNNDDIVL